MPFYKVRKGYTWGVDKSPAGTIVELTEREAFGFGFKLEPVPDPNATAAEFRVSIPDPGAGDDSEIVISGALAPGEEWGDLPDGLIDALEDAGLFPEDLRAMDDTAILEVDGVGPSSLAKIRAIYPKAG